MTVFMLVLCALFIIAFPLVMRFNMHMFQLNGYKNNEQRAWLKKNASKQWILYVGIIIGAIGVVFPNILTYIIILIWLLLISIIYYLYGKQKAKKPLVYTPRVKRMIATETIVSIFTIAIVWLACGGEYIPGTVIILISIHFVLTIIANTINKPIEKSISNGFINDAKRMLAGVDGITVIGITGSYGKTSVKFYLNTLLKEHFNVLMTPESYNTPMGVVRTIREHLKPTDEIFICEMGARYVGDIKEICDIVHPTHGIITSIGPQHLETFGNIEHIKNTKFELADAIKGKGTLFLNGDNEYINDKAKGYDNKIFYHAKTETNGYYAKDVKVSNLGTEFTVVSPTGEEERFNMRLIGEHNIINVVGAISVANSLGISLRDLKIPVRRIESVPHRLQLIERGNVTIIDDAFNSNPIGSKAAVETLAMFEGVKILVTPGMVELGEKEDEYNKKFGEYAAKCCDYILLIGEKHTAPIREGAICVGFPENKIATYERLQDALSYAYTIRDEGKKYILLENDLPDNY